MNFSAIILYRFAWLQKRQWNLFTIPCGYFAGYCLVRFNQAMTWGNNVIF